MIQSPICEMLGIRYPVFQGGMAWIADGRLAAAVFEGGGLGIIGAGNPSKYMNLWMDAGCKVIPIVPSVAMARLMTRLGASAVIAEGGESGGHVGELSTMVPVPLIKDATYLPVIAAGGIANGRGMASAIMLAPAACSWAPGSSALRNAPSILPTRKRSWQQRILAPWSPANG